MKAILDENDLKTIFGGPEPNKIYQPAKLTWLTLLNFAIIFIVIFFFSYFVINAPALIKKFQYTWDTSIKKQAFSKAVTTPTPQAFNQTAEAQLVIPKIGVDAPIIWNIENKDLNAKLLEGVVHSSGTALPGAVGNIFITGHSSYYSWVQSPYKDVFALLDSIGPGDQIFIKYNNKIFTYQVNTKKIVSPNETSVMNQGNGYNLSLMTCVPVGTNLNRLIISASQLSIE